MKKLWVLVTIALLAVIGLNLITVCRLHQNEYENKLADLAKLRQTIYEAEYMNGQLRARVKHLKSDQGVEEVAREKLGLIHPEETAYVVVPTQPPAQPEPMTFPMLAQRDDDTLFFAFLHAAFGPEDSPLDALKSMTSMRP